MGADCLWRGSSDRAEQACQGWLGGEGRAQFTAARSLVVQDVGGILCLKILHLQDPVKVLQPLVIVGHVGGQVAVDDADIVAVKLQKDVDTPFVPLEGALTCGTGGRAVGLIGKKMMSSILDELSLRNG